MTLIDKAVKKFIEELDDVLTVLSSRGTTNPPLPGLFLILLITSLLILSRSSVEELVLFASALSSTPLLLLAMRRSGRGYFLALVKTGVLVVVFSAIVSAPLIITNRAMFLGFIERIATISTEIIAVMGLAGWPNILGALSCLGVPSEIIYATDLMTRFIPLLGIDALHFLEARRARSLGDRGLREAWRVLATALSSLLEKSYSRSYQLSLAIRARSLGYSRPRRALCLSHGDIVGVILYAPIVATIASYLVTQLA